MTSCLRFCRVFVSFFLLGIVSADFLDSLLQETTAPIPFSGGVRVDQNGQVVTKYVGYASEEFRAPLTEEHKFGIASNSKLFTAVSIYQLQEQNLLNISDSVGMYLNGRDFHQFGFPNQTSYCPRLVNSTICLELTFEQLLGMRSGLIAVVNCNNLPQGKANALCHFHDFLQPSLGQSLADYVGLFINDPLLFKPGAKFQYVNTNYILLAYLIEKISHKSLQEYWQQHIIHPLGLQNTIYDPLDGAFRFIPNRASTYIRIYDNDTFISDGACPIDFNPGSKNGAAGIFSTLDDLIIVYKDLFSAKGTRSKLLSRNSIEAIVTPVATNVTAPMYYGHGIEINVADVKLHPFSQNAVFGHTGGRLCTVSEIRMYLDDNNRETIVAAYSNHPLIQQDKLSLENGTHGYNQVGRIVQEIAKMRSMFPGGRQ